MIYKSMDDLPSTLRVVCAKEFKDLDISVMAIKAIYLAYRLFLRY